jgi:aspartyl/asparaginyl beta-hydroxylase (cupin superfamily)
VGDEWTSWSVGKVLLFDDSFEHEVRNDADEERVVLLIRVWHPELMSRRRMGLASQLVAEAIAKKEEAVQKRYHPPL